MENLINLQNYVSANDIHNSLENELIDIKDGQYKVYFEWVKPTLSEMTVDVQARKMDIAQLKKATAEILRKNGYWGRFIEEAWYDEDQQAISIFVGS